MPNESRESLTSILFGPWTPRQRNRGPRWYEATAYSLVKSRYCSSVLTTVLAGAGDLAEAERANGAGLARARDAGDLPRAPPGRPDCCQWIGDQRWICPAFP
jgi:hypothetical protein